MSTPAGPAFEALVGAWRFDAIDGGPVLADVEATIEFHDDGRVAGTAGVNRFAGEWSIAEDSLMFGPLATTLMAGPPDRMEQEGALLRILGSGPLVVTLEGAALVLAGSGKLELTKSATAT